jgi:hypothetical protein
MGHEKEDVERAEESADVLRQRLAALLAEVEREVTAQQAKLDPQRIVIRKVQVGARKSDIEVQSASLLWVPVDPGSER